MTPDLIGASAGARLLNVSRARFNQLADTSDFPAPREHNPRRWDPGELRAYRVSRTDQRAATRDQRRTALAIYRATRNAAAAARAAGVDERTVRRWTR